MVTVPSCFPALPREEAAGLDHIKILLQLLPWYSTPHDLRHSKDAFSFLLSVRDRGEPRELHVTSFHWLSWQRGRKHVSSRRRPPRNLNLGGWNVLYVLGHAEDGKPLPACPKSCKQHNERSLGILNVTRYNLKSHWEALMQTPTVELPRSQGQL